MRQESLLVSMISQWWVSRPCRAVVISASPKASLVATKFNLRSLRRLIKGKKNWPLDCAKGRHPFG